MKLIFVVIISAILYGTCVGQVDALAFGAPIKWDKINYAKDNFRQAGIDTITNDSIIITSKAYYRISDEGDVREEIVINKDPNMATCSCDGLKIGGSWKAYYDNGDVKEIGTINCNRKADEWIYFHPNGKLRKYENYLRLELMTNYQTAGYLSGLSKEYYDNGNVKSSGTYKIVEILKEHIEFDVESYEEVVKCCSWYMTSVKHGLWTEYDVKGNVISQKDESINVDVLENYRDVTDAFIVNVKVDHGVLIGIRK